MMSNVQATTAPTAPARPNAPAAPARAAGSAQPVAPAAGAPARPTPSAIANRMTAAPQGLPLSAIPTEWVPMGTSQRRVDTRSGFLVFDRGHVRLQRNANSLTVGAVDNRNLGGISLRSDPRDPSSITATTPAGTFTGRLTGSGNDYDFRANDRRHNIHIKRENGNIRFDTEGFGKLDHGHMNVYDR